SILDAMREEIREAAPRNFARWTLISGSAWPGEVERVKNYLRVRAEWIDSQFTRPPVVSPPGQEIEPGFEVTISAPAGEIWYTLDGSDPRVPGGAVSPNAIRYNGPVSIDENVRLFARARVGSNWSGFVAETYYTELPRLVISELMFHPPPPLSTGDARDEDYEFIELFNASDEPLDLDGFAIEGGVRFVFGPGEPLAPGAYVVVVKNLDAFEDRYGSGGIRIAGEYEGRLDNSGEDLSLFGPLREPVLSFAYSEDWYPAADGDGASIVILDPFDDLSLWGEPSAWAESTVVLGTPGEDDPGLTGLGGRRRPGDLNEDGLVDLSDAIGALRRLFLATSAPLPCEGSGPLDGGNRAIFDVNDDATFDLSDGVYLLEWIFKSGSAPVRGTSCIRIEGCSTVCF
ncbi:MAG TPA: lamin tail domain-containing protein, partial [Planctomycetota bacterium]|nr:lamin tail domain-containing protein [Planctomycetota bacterium]